MTDPITIALLVTTLVAVAAAVWFWKQGEEAAGFRQERDEQRERADRAMTAATEARTRLEGEQETNRGLRQHAEDLQRQIGSLRDQHQEATTELADVKARVGFADTALKTMKETFELQSSDALRKALTDLRKAEDEGREQREKLDREKLSAQLKPVADTLERFEKHVNDLEQKRVEDVGGLKAQIEGLMKASEQTQAEAKKLSSALRRGTGVQGRWGEQTLQRVLELAGLKSRFDYQEQVHLVGEDGSSRPDVVINLAGGGAFVVDAKCSLNAFLDAQDAADEPTREAALSRHAASIKAHVAGLSGKTYWDQFKGKKSPDFVAMFVPGDSFLVAALDRVPDLMTDAMDRRVIIVTPTTLFALCKAVAYGWRVEEQAQNADQVARLGRDLYKRLATMGGYVKGVGGALDEAVEKYNQFIGSLDSQVMTQARRFEDLKVDHEAKEIPELKPIDNRARVSTKLSAGGPDGGERLVDNQHEVRQLEDQAADGPIVGSSKRK